MLSNIAFISLAAIPLTPRALHCVPRLSRCNPTATFHPSSADRTNTYRLFSVSLIEALRTWNPLNSPVYDDLPK